MRSAFLIAPLLMMLSACAGEPTRMGASTKLVEAEEAILMPPPGSFSVAGITQKRFSNGLQQEIFLSTTSAVPGQNVVQMRLYGTRNDLRYRDDHLRFRTVTEAGIDAEMRGTLPGIPMKRSPYLVQNDYGAFGYAFGRPSPTELCMYAWQQLRTPEGEKPPFAGFGAVQIRVRICETGASERKLLAFMYGYSIIGAVDDMRWNPYGPPGPVSDRLGHSGNPIYPPEMTAGAEPDAARPVAVGRPARRAVQPVAEPVPTALPGAERVVVPSPVRASSAAQPAANVAPASSAGGTIVPSPACVGANAATAAACP